MVRDSDSSRVQANVQSRFVRLERVRFDRTVTNDELGKLGCPLRAFFSRWKWEYVSDEN